MSSAKIAVVYSTLGQYSVQFLALIGTIIYSRLLPPTEIGYFVVANGIFAITNEFRSLGVGSYITRQQTMDSEEIQRILSTCYIFSVSILLAINAACISLRNFTTDYQTSEILQILSIPLLYGPVAIVSSAILARNMAFKRLFFARLAMAICSLASGVGLVFAGFGAYGLAIAAVVGSLAEFFVLSTSHAFTTHSMPKLRFDMRFFRFGLNIAAINSMGKIQSEAPVIWIGHLGASGDAALFSRGQSLLRMVAELILKGVRPVALPYLSAHASEPIERRFMRLSLATGMLVLPTITLMTVCSSEIVRILFGDEWLGSVDVAVLLGISHLVGQWLPLSGAYLIKTNQESFLFRLSILVTVSTIIACPIGYLTGGLMGACVPVVCIRLMEMVLTALKISNDTELALKDALAFMGPAYLASSAVLAVALVTKSQLNPENSAITDLVIITTACIPAWLLISYKEVKKILH